MPDTDNNLKRADEQIEVNLRRAEVTALRLAHKKGSLDAVALALILKHPDIANDLLKESLGQKSLALEK